jgi:hypothetical protein
MKQDIKSLVLAGLLAASVPAVWADGSGHPPGGQDMQAHWQERMAQRAAELKAQLKLSPEQEQDWARYLEALKPAQPPVRPDPRELARLSTPERLERMRALRQQRDAEMQRREEATRSFYATLNAEQKKVFDEQTARFWAPRRPR